jgi:hypothetical protein
MHRGFNVEPNPAVAGQPVEVTYTGNETEVTWWVDGGPVQKQKVPPKTFPIDPVPTGLFLVLSDGNGMGGAFRIEEIQ